MLEDELSKPEYGPSVLKHLIQNSSLLGQLDKTGLLENGNTFVEFGSGRGQLTYWLTKAVDDATTCQFLLVDRASHRHKFDNRLKEVEDLELVRLRVDIADLALGRVSPHITQQKENIVGVRALKVMIYQLSHLYYVGQQAFVWCCHRSFSPLSYLNHCRN